MPHSRQLLTILLDERPPKTFALLLAAIAIAARARRRPVALDS